MDMGRRVNSIEKGPGMHGTVTVKVEPLVEVHVRHSTEKQKQASNSEVLFSLDAGTDCPRWWSLYRRSRKTSYIQGDPVHWGHMSSTATLKVNFA